MNKVTAKQIFELVKSGVNPLVKMTNRVFDETIWDEGMIGRVEDAKIEMVDEDTGQGVYVLNIREDIFRVINEEFMKREYYDDYGNPTLTYLEANAAPSNGIEETWVMENDEFFLLDDNSNNGALKLFFEYLNENTDKSYVKWLENKIFLLTK